MCDNLKNEKAYVFIHGLKINKNIFPAYPDSSIGGFEDDNFSSTELPRYANLLYLQSIDNSLEYALLKKYANSEAFTDDDYKNLFQFLLGDEQNVPVYKYGIQMVTDGEKRKMILVDKYIPQIRIETWEWIIIDLLRPLYTDIIDCFDWGDINIDLRSWKNDDNIQKQSLLNTFRTAFMFTILGYLYGDDDELHNSFEDFFDKEFYKRIALINGIWKNRKADELIKYIPVFDSFYNLDGMTLNELRKMIGSILDDENIAIDERDLIRNRLIDGAEEFRKIDTLERTSLEHDLIKPVVNFVIELQNAKDALNVAKILNTGEEAFFSTIINRCYYSMMHATKALLEYEKQLSDWDSDKLNVEEKHNALTRKLEVISQKKIIDKSYVAELKYVKQKRWVADYNLSVFTRVECDKCINYAEKFLDKVKQITM